MSDFTPILSEIESGDPKAAEKLLPLVYDELRKLAAARLACERPGQTLDATALVHEAYMRLADQPTSRTWEGRGHFFAAAAEAMRRILVENARRKASLKRGGEMKRLELDEIAAAGASDADELIALDEALELLARTDVQVAELVKLRYFGGLTMDEAAKALGISSRTAYYAWEYARSWLRRELRGNEKTARGP